MWQMWFENIQIHMSQQAILFSVWKFAQLKNIYEKGIYFLFIIFFEKKKSLDLKKIKNHVTAFPYWFWFGTNFFKCLK
jgi:hypothetical protein